MSKTNETKAKQTAITILYPDGSKRRFGSRFTASRFINAGFRRHGSDETFYASLMRQFEDGQTHLYWTTVYDRDDRTYSCADIRNRGECPIQEGAK